MTDALPFELIEDVADAVMFEGYVLYPYRASAMKNRFRWQFGVVAPHVLDEATREAPSHVQTECLVECDGRSSITVKVRCLRLQRRTIEHRVPGSGEWQVCDRVTVDGRELLTWDEATIETALLPSVVLESVAAHPYTLPFEFASAAEHELVSDSNGVPAARVTRERRSIKGLVSVASERIGQFAKVRVRIENTTQAESAGVPRDDALQQSLLGCHTLLHVRDGRFVSLIDPPAEAAAIARSCANQHTWPVLVGPAGSRDLMLSAPIILYDYPAIAPESRDRFFDATEIDEMLALRVQTLTDDEKREAEATDAYAGSIVRRAAGPCDAPLHGAIRSFEEFLNPSPSSASADPVEVDSVRVSPGSRVRLRPRMRADSMDMFLAGRIATIVAVHHDLESRVYLAVTIDDDPGADLHDAYGRFFYFFPDEVQPVEAEARRDA